MAWSKHEDGKQNLMLRMISGGPVYFSDGLGNTDSSMIWPMILEDGTVLRCEDVGRPTLDCLTRDVVGEGKPLKVYNRYGDTIYTAAFSIQKAEEQESDKLSEISGKKGMTGRISREDFPLELPEEYWIYDWSEQTAVLCSGKNLPADHEVQGIAAVGEYEFFMEPRDAALFHIIPVKDRLQVIGILEKYMSGICVERIWREEQEYFVILKCEGTFGFLTKEQVREVRYGGRQIPVQRQGDLCRVNCQGGSGILQIKLE